MKVVVIGAAGRMGREVLKALSASPEFEVVAAVDREQVGVSCGEIVGDVGLNLVIEDKLGAALDRTKPDALVDFSNASGATAHALSAITRGICPVIGTTGLSEANIRELASASRETSTPGIYAPNFAIGAVLMMRFSQLAAKWLPNCEIIELHHDRKEDAPSGTALLTAQMIADARKEPPGRKPRPIFKVEGVRGGLYQETPIHSVRLPGYVAHQEVIFGGTGEVLTIRHDSMDRVSFMEGVKLCLREVRGLNGFVVGMDKILFR
ncbi:MAG TPA: 4-hydroxy-tetrahydrodipicolinate reductase [Fimbriimonadaceae bacterium]|nr:4-hydroxy-tetrahydrodipicolinate reductase [Fimbriimonadaceae bacterium]